MSYCTIQSYDDDRDILGCHSSKEAALRAAISHCHRTGEGVEVVWCKERGNPKVWLAYVTPLGVEKTEFWNEGK